MTYFDLFVLSMIALSGIFAWIRGIVREIITLLCLALAAWAVFMFGEAFGSLFGDGLIGPIIGYFVLFVAVLMSASILFGVGWNKLSGRTPPLPDKILGAIFGIVRGWFLMGLVYLASTYYFDENDLPAAMENAALRGVVAEAAQILENLGLERETMPSGRIVTE